MSTRKIIRNNLRREAEVKSYRPSIYIRAIFDEIQRRKYGWRDREINKAKGTKPRRNWCERIRAVIEDK